MKKSLLILALLLVACFSLATYLQPRRAAWQTGSDQSGNVLMVLLGDGRKMFADAFLDKADAYFHRGNYPSIFDRDRPRENHMAGEAAHGEHAQSDQHDEIPEPAKPPHDWIERFNRHFHPTEHTHLSGGQEREMLPWLTIAADLDPHRILTYTLTAYWLRDRLGNVDEAEQFLRKGLAANPNDPELLYELGRLLFESRKDSTRAYNLWSVALRRWKEVEGPKETPNLFLLEEILGGLARIELDNGRYAQAIEYLKQLKEASPDPDAVQKLIDSVTRKMSEPPSVPQN